MKFSDRLKIVVKYYKWLNKQNYSEEDYEIMDCHETFLVFLETEGLLKDEV